VQGEKNWHKKLNKKQSMKITGASLYKRNNVHLA
jgi:hypothetical protein